jgi:membrane-bound lytic murein transglycosylase D
LAALVSGPERLRYRVKSGDALSIIADRYGVSVKQIRSWNNLRGNVIRVGQHLTIYPRRYPKS